MSLINQISNSDLNTQPIESMFNYSKVGCSIYGSLQQGDLLIWETTAVLQTIYFLVVEFI